MKEIKVVQYQADDGKVFNTKHECERYEAELINNYIYAVYVDTTSKDEMTVSFARLNIGTDTIKISSTEVANTYTEIKEF